MERYDMGQYDIVVVGAGHAGCEAGLVCARLGKKTALFSTHLESIAMMACNPSVGGTGKGHLVREIDALGGEMGINIDKAFIQSRMLNTAKGPAVHSLRTQADKTRYHLEMKKVLEHQENLDLKQGEVVDILVEQGKIRGVVLRTGATYRAEAVILATGTFLKGKIFIGDSAYDSGPNGLAPAIELGDNLRKWGMNLRRFKTGTPARALAQSLDYEKMEEQKGDSLIVPFSFMNDMNDKIKRQQVSCWLSYTNERTHEIIRKNFGRSALFGGQIEGVGPRYCPSIEDKVNRFSDKERHQLFVEPEGEMTDEVYIQGMSTSLPEDVQQAFYKTIPGLENIRIVRPAYAIEYDCIDPTDLTLWLEYRHLENLFCAGQFNGSSGYEEAAAQGLMAGINACRKLDKQKPFILDRSQAYIGVLIDDLVTKGTPEPYRIMTSRAEYRLLLRQDNADARLTELGWQMGLVTKDRYEKFKNKQRVITEEIQRLTHQEVTPKEIEGFLIEWGSTPISNRTTLAELLKRPEITYEKILSRFPSQEVLSMGVKTSVEVTLKYEGYIEKQLQQVQRFRKLEERQLDPELPYLSIEGLRLEARQKLEAHRPGSLGQASRISGVSPADINVLLVYLEKRKRMEKESLSQ
jgi:tRNA uridine 5-carboxymethylaminomethyl modification enzyme